MPQITVNSGNYQSNRLSDVYARSQRVLHKHQQSVLQCKLRQADKQKPQHLTARPFFDRKGKVFVPQVRVCHSRRVAAYGADQSLNGRGFRDGVKRYRKYQQKYNQVNAVTYQRVKPAHQYKFYSLIKPFGVMIQFFKQCCCLLFLVQCNDY